MTDRVELAIIGLLEDAAQRALAPDAARAALAALQRAYPDVGLRLVWEAEQYARRFHYEVLIERRDGSTLVLALGQARGLPFLARACFRPAENDLVRVDGVPLTVEQAIEHVELAYDPQLRRQLVDAMLVRQAAHDPVEVSGDELQHEMDAFRQRAGLHRARELRRWLSDRGMTQEALEVELEHAVRARKLAEAIVGDRARAYFARHRSDFDRLAITTITATTRSVAESVARRLRSGEALLDLIDEHGDALAVQVDEWTPRRQLPAALRRRALATRRWIGPVTFDGRFVVLRVGRRQPATWNRDTHAEVHRVLLESWLARRRRRAHVEWFWGRTSP